MIQKVKIENNCIIIWTDLPGNLDDNTDIIPIKSVTYQSAIITHRFDDDEHLMKKFGIGIVNVPTQLDFYSIRFTEETAQNEDVRDSLLELQETYKKIKNAISKYHGGFMLNKPINFEL
jgi:hypothetical protein